MHKTAPGIEIDDCIKILDSSFIQTFLKKEGAMLLPGNYQYFCHFP